MTRHDVIRHALDLAIEEGIILDYYSYAPGDDGKRWSVSFPGSSRVFSTREVEAFLLGIEITR